jgi:hypothetical protein
VVIRAQMRQQLQDGLSKVYINNQKKLAARMERLQELANGMEAYQNPRLTAEAYADLKAAGTPPPSRPRG